MVVHAKHTLLLIIVTCVTVTTVQGVVGNKLREIVSAFSNPTFFDPIVEKHLQNIRVVSPLYIIIDPKADEIALDYLLIKYMQLRTSYLYNNEELILTHVGSCTTIGKVVGIYSDVSHVKPLKQREFFGKLWTPRAKFAFWISNIVVPEIVQTVLEKFWSIDCIDVSIIMTSLQRSDIFRYTYNPFMMTSRGRGTLIKHSTTDKFFPNKFQNLYGYEIPISVYHAVPKVYLINYTTLEGARGPDIEVLKYFSSFMNFTILLKSSPLPLSSYTQYLPNKTQSSALIGPVGDIIKGRSVMLGNPQLLNLATDLYLDFLYPLKNVEVQIVVPVDKELSSIARMFRYTNPISHVAILISVAFFSLYIAIVHKRNILTTYFQFLLQKSISSVSNRMSERILFFSWLVFIYIVATVHESHITKSLTDRTTSQIITTPADVVNSDLKIILDRTHFKALKTNIPIENLIHRTEINPNFDDCMLRLGKGERVACIGAHPIVNSGLDTYNRKLIGHNRKIIQYPYIIKTQKFYFSTLIVRKGFPYCPKFNEGYLQIYGYGFVHKWKADAHVRRFKLSREFEGTLRLSHFQGVFGILAICIIIANMTFIGEIIFHYIKTNISI